MPTPSRRTFLVGCVTAATGLAGCAIPGSLESRRTSRDVSVPAESELVVDNRNGDVLVEDGGGDTATVEIEKSTRYGADLLDQVSVETTTTGGQFRVETTDDTPPNESVSVDLTISLPEDVTVGRCTTTNGDVTARDVAGDATLETTNGDALADTVSGYVTLRSGNGDVTTRSVTGVDRARTTNGDVDVEVPATRTDVTLRTTNGDVGLAVPEDLDAVITLRTTNGDVGYSGLDLETTVDRSDRIRGVLGDGGDVVDAETTNGDVRLRPL